MVTKWTGTVTLGTGFWLFLSLIILLSVALACGWFKGSKLANMLSYSMTGDRSKVFSEN